MPFHPKLFLKRKRAIDALNAYEILRKHRINVSLSDIAAEYVRSYKATLSIPSCSLGKCCETFYDSVPVSQVRNRDTYRSLIRRILDALPLDMPLRSLTETDCLKFLESASHPGTFNSLLRRTKALLNWAVRKKYIPRNPASGVALKVCPYQEPAFFNVGKVERIFRIAVKQPYEGDVPMGMFLTLGFYAGLRTSEILRTRWEDVRVEEGLIRIPMPKGITNGGKPRIVELEPKAVRLLQRFAEMSRAEMSSLIVPSVWKVSQWKKAHLKPRGLSWGNDEHHNVMRHTYATMHVAAFRDAGVTALNLGHGEGIRILEKHYRGLASHAEGLRYWR